MNPLFIKGMCRLADQELARPNVLMFLWPINYGQEHRNKTHKDILITPTQETLKSAVNLFMINLFITIQIRLRHYHILSQTCDQIYCPMDHDLVPRTEGVHDSWFPYGKIYHVIFYPRYIRDPISFVPDGTLYQERTRNHKMIASEIFR